MMDASSEPPGRRPSSNGHTASDPALSPGFRANADTPAFELKFMLPAERAAEVLSRVTQHMSVDPHSDPALGHAYQVHGLYFDTAEFHVFHRIGSHAWHKLRLRRYGESGPVFLEHKMKARGQVRKRRTSIVDDEIMHLGAPRSPANWQGMWFRKRMKSRKVQPVCEVSYLRQAFTGGVNGEQYRLTFDRSLTCRPFDGWAMRGVETGNSLLTDELILELKFCDAMPGFFKGLIADFQLEPSRISKYRLSVAACGLAPRLIVPPVDERRDEPPGESLSRTA